MADQTVAAEDPAGDPIGAAVEAFERLESYSVLIDSTAGGERELIRYSYLKPGYVRMEFVTPHRGAVLVYDPGTGKVHLRPFGFIRPLVLVLNPGNRLVRSSAGHRVDRSDIGSLLENAGMVASNGIVTVRGSEVVEGRETRLVRVRGEDGYELPDGTAKYLLNLDTATWLPVRVRVFDRADRLTQDVFLRELEVDPGLAPDHFRLD